jgi:carboxypeptidase Q
MIKILSSEGSSMLNRHKKFWPIGLVAVALAVLPQGVSVPAANPAAQGDSAQMLVGRELGQTPMFDDLEELCDRIGGRPTSSQACDRAVDWAAGKFNAAGVNSVHTESYTIPNRWLGEKAEAECLSPAQFPIRLAAAPGTASTPDGRELVAPLVDLDEGSADDFELLGNKARGAIALVQSKEMKSADDLFGEYVRSGPILAQAQKAGVAALLLQSTRPRGLLYRHPMTLDGSIEPLPVAIVSRENAARLARLASQGEVRIRLKLQNRTGGEYEAKNVVAEIRGSDKPDEIVLIGAHLDSWDLGTGAEDNGVNAAMVIDLARNIKALGLKPRRTIRFVLFTGEEQGLLGSEAYVRAHVDELDRHVAMITFDTGSGRTVGFDLNGRAELRRPVEEALRAVGGLSPMNLSNEALDGTDNFDFLLSGVPNLVAMQDWDPYLPNYHAESDTFGMVDQRNAQLNAAIAAALVWGLANQESRLAPRLTRAEVEKLLEQTGLNQQMKAFGQWEAWAAGKRGISK